MTPTTRRTMLGALIPLLLAVSPALARGATPPSRSRTGQTIIRFYDHAERFTVRRGFERLESESGTLSPVYATFLTESRDGTLGPSVDLVGTAIHEGVETFAQAPLIGQEAAAANQVAGSTSGAAHHDARLLATFFADELHASRSLHARHSLTSWERDHFLAGEPAGIDGLNAFVSRHRDFLSEEVEGSDPFRSVEAALPREQRTVIALQARCLAETTDGLAILTAQVARGWEGTR